MEKYKLNIRVISETLELVFKDIAKIQVRIVDGESKNYIMNDNEIDAFTFSSRPRVLALKRFYAKRILIEIPKEYELAEIKVNSVSGDIVYNHMDADMLHFKTTSGNICGLSTSADVVNVESVSGYIGLERILAEDLSFKTISGKIKILEVIGRAEFTTVSGAIDIKSYKNKDDIHITSVKGVVRVGQPV